MIQAFFIGESADLYDQLAKYYKAFRLDPNYYLSTQFLGTNRNNWQELLPKTISGLIYYEITDNPEKDRETIEEIKKTNSKFQWVLLADPKVDYFEIARNLQIGNILQKNHFDQSIIRALTIRLMTGNLFGFNPYFPNGFAIKPLFKTVSGVTNLKEILDYFEEHFLPHMEEKLHNRMSTYFNELLVNTVTYSIAGMTPEERDEGNLSIAGETYTPVDKAFKISMAMDEEKYGISIIDSTGTLTLDRILQKLRRQTKIGDEEHPPGIWDLSGRGLSLILKDNRMIINILKEHYTEIIFLHYKEPTYNKYESIIITELSPMYLA